MSEERTTITDLPLWMTVLEAMEFVEMRLGKVDKLERHIYPCMKKVLA